MPGGNSRDTRRGDTRLASIERQRGMIESRDRDDTSSRERPKRESGTGGRRIDRHMRLTCSKCEAIYEIDDTVIPGSGREVRCGDCGWTWRQTPVPPERAGTAGSPRAMPDRPPEEDDPQPKPKPTGPGAEVIRVLREEAERETRARRTEAEATAAMVCDPGDALDAGAPEVPARPPRTGKAGPARYGESNGNADLPGTGWNHIRPAPRPPNGRNRSPNDIIGSGDRTLSAHPADPAGWNRKSRPDRYRGQIAYDSRTGRVKGTWLSVFMILTALVAVLVYSFAPRILQSLPQAEPQLIAYVELVNELRPRIKGSIEAVIAILPGASDS